FATLQLGRIEPQEFQNGVESHPRLLRATLELSAGIADVGFHGLLGRLIEENRLIGFRQTSEFALKRPKSDPYDLKQRVLRYCLAACNCRSVSLAHLE